MAGVERRCWLIAVVVFALTSVGCADGERPAADGDSGVASASTSTSTSRPDSTGDDAAVDPAESLDDRTAVLVAAVAHRVAVDNTFGGEHAFDHVSIVDHFGPSPDDPRSAPEATGAPIDPAARAAIDSALGTTTAWIGEDEARALAERGWTDTGGGPGAIVRIAEPVISADRAEVTTELECGDMCGIQSTHVVVRDPAGTWRVDGTIGPITMS